MLAALAAVASACSENPGPAVADAVDAKADAKGPTTKDVPALLDGQICLPGSTESCYSESQVKQCSADGSGWQIVSCRDSSGVLTLCSEPGICQVCAPGNDFCDPKDSTHILNCDAKGQLASGPFCDVNKGHVCAGGTCVKACDFNAKAKTYAGCAFWAVDLDNAFVPGGTQSYYDAANSQYAIVIANASDKLLSGVTIATNVGVQEFDSKAEKLDYSPLQPGELRVYNLPPRNIDATTQEMVAWRVTSTAPVAAYQFNPLENVNVYSNDASLLLPDEVLGKYYIVMAREQSFSILRGFVTVIGTKFGIKTKVTITFGPMTRKTLPGTIKKLSADGKSIEIPIKSFASNEAATFELEEHEVLNIETDKVGSDLTGTVVQANQPVAVFAGSEAANAPNTNHCNVDKCSDAAHSQGDKCGVCEWDGKTPCNNNEHCQQFITCCADHLEMQQFPVKSWGSHYVAIKLKPRAQEADSWRILAAKDGTKVALVPPQKDPYTGKSINIAVLNAGEWFEFEAGRGIGPKYDNTDGGVFEIVAKDAEGNPAPISVGHFMQSQDSPGPGAQQGDAATGDPAYLLAIPVEQWRTSYVFLTPQKYSTNWISIAAPIHRSCGIKSGNPGKECTTDEECASPARGVQAGSCVDDVQVLFDGAPLAPDAWKPVSKNYKFTWQNVTPGVHNIKTVTVYDNDGAARTPQVAVDAYGFDSYVSYGYPAGLDLKDLTLFKEPGE
ncbi:MAG: hypothetical protein EXR77_15925 [Myxococcales bacterium]|nr:hypothetical protein [Myxococcales bacterium]